MNPQKATDHTCISADPTDIPAFIRRIRGADHAAAPAHETHRLRPETPPADHAEVLRGMIEDATYARDQSRQDQANHESRAAALDAARRNLTPKGGLCTRFGNIIEREQCLAVTATHAADHHAQTVIALQAALALLLATDVEIEF